MNQDLSITQGDEKAYNLTFSSGNGALDITGSTVKMTVQRTKTSAPLVEKTVTTHTEPLNGKTTITLTPTDTGIPLGDYYYDIQINGGTIAKKTVMKGKLNITWQATED